MTSLRAKLRPPTGAGFFAHVGVSELASDIRAGRVSPRDLIDIAILEASRWQPVINAFVTLDETGARTAAERAAKELAAGLDRGPLHGIPIAVKDMIDVRGLPTTAGSRHFAGRIAQQNAECVERLVQAGAIIVGKTTTHEFANGPTGDRSASGATRNPYATDRMAGGSSSGSAAAVAAGIVPLALGTDTGGSARIPAACCGVVGFKPTHGALASSGIVPLAPSLDTVGLLARTAADCSLLWTALAGARPFSLAPRIGWVIPDSICPTEPAITRAAWDLVGDRVTGEVAVPEANDLREAYRTIQGSEAYALHAERISSAPELYDPEVLDRLRAGSEVLGWEYVRAVELRESARRRVARHLDHHGILALPTIPLPPPLLDSRVEQIDGHSVDTRKALLSLTSPWSVLGLPAISIPAGLVSGLPTGLQLVGPPGAETHLLSVAEQLQDPNYERKN